MFADCRHIVLAAYVLGLQLLVWQHVTVDKAQKRFLTPFSPQLLVWQHVTVGVAPKKVPDPFFLALAPHIVLPSLPLNEVGVPKG